MLSTVATELIQVSEHGQGADIAIGGLYGIAAGKRIGVLPVGLGHGLSRPKPGMTAYVLLRGLRAPVLAVSLEHTTIDLDAVVDARAGDPVLLLGRDGHECVTLDTVAAWGEESPLQCMMRFSGRAEMGFMPQEADRRAGATRQASKEER